LLPKSLRMRFFSVNEYCDLDAVVEAVVMCLPPRLLFAQEPRGAAAGGPRVRGPGEQTFRIGKLPVGSRWYCRHQHAFSRYFQLPTRLARRIALQRPKAGGLRPQPP